MKMHIESAPGEFEAKGVELVRKLCQELGHAHPKLQSLAKALDDDFNYLDHLVQMYGPDVEVFKQPLNGALTCEYCQRLHIGPDGQPRIFKLADLPDDNTGRKKEEWEVVRGITHPSCACEISHMPTGWGFDDDGHITPNGKGGMRYTAKSLQKAMAYEDFLKADHPTVKKLVYQGIHINIENTPGSIRHWHDERTGMKGKTRMLYNYGYVVNSKGADGDGYDVFVGPVHDAPLVFIMHQAHPHAKLLWDEDKAVLGVENSNQAKQLYLAHYDSHEFLGSMTVIGIDEFKDKVYQTRVPGSLVSDGMIKSACGLLLQPISNGGSSNAKVFAYPVQRPSFLSKSDGVFLIPFGVPSAATDRIGPPSHCEGFNEGRSENTEQVGYVLKAHTLIREFPGLLDRVSARSLLHLMRSNVVGLDDYLQVFDGVVKPVTVLMVDNLPRIQRPTEMSFHNNSMLKSLLPSTADLHVDKPIFCLASEKSFMGHGSVSRHNDDHVKSSPGTRLTIDESKMMLRRASDEAAKSLNDALGSYDSPMGDRAVTTGSSGPNIGWGVPHLPVAMQDPTGLRDFMEEFTAERPNEPKLLIHQTVYNFRDFDNTPIHPVSDFNVREIYQSDLDEAANYKNYLQERLYHRLILTQTGLKPVLRNPDVEARQLPGRDDPELAQRPHDQ